jgi:serine/threonine protein kinase
MRFLSIVISISIFRDNKSAAIDVFRAWFGHAFSPAISRDPRAHRRRFTWREIGLAKSLRPGVSLPVGNIRGNPYMWHIASMYAESSPFSLFTKSRAPRGGFLSPTGGGSASRPPRFHHATRKELIEFLRQHGKSEDGQFGLYKGYKPDLNSPSIELIPDGILSAESGHDEIIQLDVEVPIYKQSHTGVYNIVFHPKKVIKYHAYCFDEKTNPYDATVVEAYFMNRLARDAPGITLNVVLYSGYVSSPGLLPSEQRKIRDVTCEGGILPHIRYMIMDKVGISLYAYMRSRGLGRIDFLEAMTLGKEMIQLLKRLHHFNIIHGDAHIGNFAFKTDDVPNSGLILIDFGRADFVDDETAGKDPQLPDCIRLRAFAAVWEINGCKVSFRSDVYKAVQMTAMSLYGMPHYLYLNSLITAPTPGVFDLKDRRFNPGYNVAQFMEIKREADFWQLGTSLNLEGVLPSTSEGIRDQIRGRLKTVSDWITNCTSKGFYTKPNYDGIIAEYDAIIAILSLPAADATVPSLAHTGAPVHKPSAEGALGVV